MDTTFLKIRTKFGQNISNMATWRWILKQRGLEKPSLAVGKLSEIQLLETKWECSQKGRWMILKVQQRFH